MRAGVAGRAVAFHLAVRAAFTCISHTVPPASPRAKAPSGHTRKPPHHFIGGAPGKNAAKDVSVLSEIGASNICENGRIAAGEPTIFFRLVSH
jgi:hypothetical protein